MKATRTRGKSTGHPTFFPQQSGKSRPPFKHTEIIWSITLRQKRKSYKYALATCYTRE